jgi:ribose/xylose/arabinose/galactoside ABC-type transport system permease subunit
MSLDARAPRWPFSLPRFRGGAAQILALVLIALLIVFWLLLGDQLFSVRALQSMAFQLLELGILSLAMMVTLLSGGLTRGNVISGFPDPIVFLGNGTLLGVPVALLIFLALCAPVAILLNKNPFGHRIDMIGSNEKATRYSGVDTKRVLLGVYLLSSLLGVVAALVMMARFNSANASYGESYLLVTILAAVLGGVDPFGSFGKVGGLLIALIVLQVISSAFNLLNFSPFLTVAIWGTLIIGVTGLTVVLESVGWRRR